MHSLFIKATCGCVVIPLDSPPVAHSMTECILLRPCDGHSNDWCFHTRPLESWKVFYSPQRNYRSDPAPRPLTDEETKTVISAISNLVIIGQAAIEMQRAAGLISRSAACLPQDESDVRDARVTT